MNLERADGVLRSVTEEPEAEEKVEQLKCEETPVQPGSSLPEHLWTVLSDARC